MVLSFALMVWAAAPPTFASPEFNVLNVKPEVAAFCNEHLASQFAARGLHMTTARQIAALLGAERQRQLLGCSNAEGSCMAELAAALGTEGLILGDLGRLGSTYQLNIRVIRSSSGEVVATWSRAVKSEDALLPALNDAAEQLTPQLKRVFEPRSLGTNQQSAGVSETATAPRAHHWPWVPTVLGGVLAVGSAVSYGVAASAHQALTQTNQPLASLTSDAAWATQQRGIVSQWLSVGALIGAGVSLAVALVWYLVGEPIAADAPSIARAMDSVLGASWRFAR